MIKKLQKSFILFVLFTFVAQSVLVHVPVKAAELPTVVSLTDVLVSDNEELTTEATTLKEKQELFVKLGLTMKDGEITKEATLMALPSQLHGDVFGEGNVVDEQNKAVGSYTIANNSIKILFNDEAVTGAPYHLVFKATYNAVETDVKAEKIVFSLGESMIVKEFTVEQEKAASTDEAKPPKEDEKSSKDDEKPSKEVEKPTTKKIKKAAKQAFIKAETRPGAPITENIITSAKITDKDGKPFTVDNPAALDQNVNIDIGWEIPEDLDVVNGDTFEFDLPNVFKMYSTVNGVLIQDGVELGTYKIDTNGHVTLTFNAEVEDRSEIKGTIKVATALNKEIITGETQQEIVFPVGDKEITVPIFLKPTNGVDISKTGVLDKGYNPTTVTWTVDINTSLSKIENAVVKDALPTGLKLNKAAVYELNVDVKGNTTQGKLVDPSKYTLAQDGTITFKDPSINKAYILKILNS